MSTIAPLIQTAVRLSVLLPVLSPWENCALDIIQKYRPPSVSVFCKSVAQCPTNQFYKILYSPSQTLLGVKSQEFPTFKSPEFVVIPVHNDLFEWNNETIWTYRLRGKNEFKLIVMANMNEDKEGDLYYLGKTFKAMWLSGIVNTVVLLQNESAVEVFTYIPFKNNVTCEDTSPVLLGNCSTALQSVFEINRIADLRKCPMRITLVDDKPWFTVSPFSGRLVSLIRELERRMNFTLVTMSPLKDGYGGLCGPEEFRGSRGQVVQGEAHFAIGSFDRKECSVLEYIGLSYTQCLAWCTPILSVNNNYVYLFLLRPFKPTVWAAIVVTAAAIVVSIFIMCSASQERVSSNNVFNLALIVYAQPPPVDFQSSAARLIVVVWLFTCLVVRTAYEGELKSQSAVPYGSHIIYDLDELVDTDLHVCTVISSLRLISGIDDPLVRRISRKAQICPNGSLYDNAVAAARYKDRAVFTSDIRCNLVSAEINPKEASLYPRTGGCIKSYQITPFITFPGSPFKNIVTAISQRCIEAGLIKKWMDLQSIESQAGTVRRYSLRQLFPALFVLCLGCAVGGVVFLMEIAFYKCSCVTLMKSARGIC